MWWRNLGTINTIKVTPYEGPPDSLTEALLKKEDLSFDGGRGVLTHPVLDNFKGQAQPGHFFTLLFQELDDVFQSFISLKSLTLFIPLFGIHKYYYQRIVRRGAGQSS